MGQPIGGENAGSAEALPIMPMSSENYFERAAHFRRLAEVSNHPQQRMLLLNQAYICEDLAQQRAAVEPVTSISVIPQWPGTH